MAILPPPKRLRRRPDDTKETILAAAERSMTLNGPSAIRLKEVAKLAGVSHPTVLHYFGNRDGLLTAVNQRTIARLAEELIKTMSLGKATSADGVGKVFEACRGGLAVQLLWLAQSSKAPMASLFDDALRSVHRVRVGHSEKQARATLGGTLELMRLTLCAAVGEALVGQLLPSQGRDAEPGQSQKLLSEMLDAHIRAKSR